MDNVLTMDTMDKSRREPEIRIGVPLGGFTAPTFLEITPPPSPTRPHASTIIPEWSGGVFDVIGKLFFLSGHDHLLVCMPIGVSRTNLDDGTLRRRRCSGEASAVTKFRSNFLTTSEERPQVRFRPPPVAPATHCA